MFQRKELKAEEPKIIIGIKHPMRYAFSIAAMIKEHGYCEVCVRKNRKYMTPRGIDRTLEDQFNDAMRLLQNAFDVHTEAQRATGLVKVYKLRW